MVTKTKQSNDACVAHSTVPDRVSRCQPLSLGCGRGSRPTCQTFVSYWVFLWVDSLGSSPEPLFLFVYLFVLKKLQKPSFAWCNKAFLKKIKHILPENRILLYYWWECKLVQPLWKTVWRFLKKLKIELPYDPAIPLLSIYWKETKALIRKDTCTPMFTAALFTIAKVCKQPVSINRWMDKEDVV